MRIGVQLNVCLDSSDVLAWATVPIAAWRRPYVPRCPHNSHNGTSGRVDSGRRYHKVRRLIHEALPSERLGWPYSHKLKRLRKYNQQRNQLNVLAVLLLFSVVPLYKCHCRRHIFPQVVEFPRRVQYRANIPGSHWQSGIWFV